MKGLKSITSWRTFLAGMLVGYFFAWGIHWAIRFYTMDGSLHEETIPYVTPSFGIKEKGSAN